jgi:chemotaxis protein methyltransferase CheR
VAEKSVLAPTWLNALRDYLSEMIGIYYSDARLTELNRHFRGISGELGFNSQDKCAKWLINTPLNAKTVAVLAKYLTIGETYFFRDQHLFNLLEQSLLPALIAERREAGKYLRIWSAGCCTGEEPYSIAILLAKSIPDLDNWRIDIIATDINNEFLTRAKNGVYGGWSFRNAPAGLKERFFTKNADGRFVIRANISNMVHFEQYNLIDQAPITVLSQPLDLIFCRNVLMYFKEEQAAKVISRFGEMLAPNGYLVLAPSEISFGSQHFATVQDSGVMLLKKSHGMIADNGRAGGVNLGKPNSLGSRLPEQSAKAGDSGKIVIDASNWFVPNADAKPATEAEHPTDAAPPILSGGPRIEPMKNVQTMFEEDQIVLRLKFYRKALGLYSRAKYTELSTFLTNHFKDARPEPTLLILLVRCLANQGDFAAALMWSEQAIEADQLNPICYYLRANVLQAMGYPTEAAKELRKALFLNSEFVMAEFSLATLLRQLGKEEKAMKHFINCLAILDQHKADDLLPESEGLTVRGLREIILNLQVRRS